VEDTALYRIVYHYRDQFESSWEEQFSERYGILRDEVLSGLDRYLNCGILKHGCALACCENSACGHSLLIPFSCKRRGVCPSCQAKRGVVFAEKLHEQVLLEQPHRHLVFSIPKRLRIYFRFDRRLFSQLYRAAWQSWCEYLDAVLPGKTPGMIMALHTAGSLLNWHPHIHAIALDGGVDPRQNFIQLPEEIDTALLQEFFAEKVLSFLLEAELVDQTTVDSMRSWKHSGFNVYAGSPIGAGESDARCFLARYLKKAPLSLERLSIDESGVEPVVRYVQQSDDSKPDTESVREMSPLEFLAELSCHIPRVFEQTTRYFGVYSPRTRGVRRREAEFEKLLQNNFEPLESLPEQKPKPTQSWARCMKLVFELDPLLCPKCGSAMKIKSFILSSREIERICKHQGLVSWRAPPQFWCRGQGGEKIWLDESQEFSQIQ